MLLGFLNFFWHYVHHIITIIVIAWPTVVYKVYCVIQNIRTKLSIKLSNVVTENETF